MSKSKSVKLAIELECRADSTQRTLILTCICIFAIELAVELECRVDSTQRTLILTCICIFAIELAAELECRAGSTDFDFDMYMYFCC